MMEYYSNFIPFLQRGISWHLSSFERCVKNEGKHYQETNVHCSILDDDSMQDSDTVLAIILASLRLYKKANPEVTEAYLRADNAACYKSQRLIQSLYTSRHTIEGLTIKAFLFSEPGGGKSKCDTVSSFQSISTTIHSFPND